MAHDHSWTLSEHVMGFARVDCWCGEWAFRAPGWREAAEVAVHAVPIQRTRDRRSDGRAALRHRHRWHPYAGNARCDVLKCTCGATKAVRHPTRQMELF